MVAGWKLERKAKRALVKVAPFARLTKTQRAALEEEAHRLGDVIGLEAELVVQEP